MTYSRGFTFVIGACQSVVECYQICIPYMINFCDDTWANPLIRNQNFLLGVIV